MGQFPWTKLIVVGLLGLVTTEPFCGCAESACSELWTANQITGSCTSKSRGSPEHSHDKLVWFEGFRELHWSRLSLSRQW